VALALVSALLIVAYMGSRKGLSQRKAVHMVRVVNAFIRRTARLY
jgi:hypothetical protein